MMAKGNLLYLILFKDISKSFVLLTPVVNVLVGEDFLLSVLWETDFLGAFLCSGKISNNFLLQLQQHHNRKKAPPGNFL